MGQCPWIGSFSRAGTSASSRRARFSSDRRSTFATSLIDYLFATSGGVGYKLIATDTLSLSVDSGVGVSWEKNPGLDVDTSGVITSGEQFLWKVSPSATITQGFSSLWDADDFGDALYTFSAGLASSVLKQIELKIELLDAYKTKPPNDLVKKNDVAFLTAVVFKF